MESNDHAGVPRILIVEDDESVALTLLGILEIEGYAVDNAVSVPEALEKVERTRFDVAVLDLSVAGKSGLRVLKRLKETSPRSIGIILTAYGSMEVAVEALRAGADDFLVKPCDIEQLKASIARSFHWSEEISAQNTLRRLAEEQAAVLQELSQFKEEFIAIASHDLKSPLASIKGYAQFLLRRLRAPRPDLEQLEEGLIIIDTQAAAMGLLLNNLLDASRIQGGTLPLETAPCDLEECLEKVIARLNPEERKRVDISLPRAPLTGDWDQDRVAQVIANLVGNALKYSPESEPVSVVVGVSGSEIEVAVSDRGIGIPSQELPGLFQRFHRTPQAQATGLPGTGLGLYISHSIITAHGGSIWAESPGEGQGTTFRFTLPAESPYPGPGEDL